MYPTLIMPKWKAHNYNLVNFIKTTGHHRGMEYNKQPFEIKHSLKEKGVIVLKLTHSSRISSSISSNSVSESVDRLCGSSYINIEKIRMTIVLK